MSFGNMGFSRWAGTVGRASGITLVLATTAAAHEGHVIGTGFAASMVHTLEHGLGALVLAAAAMAIAGLVRRRPRRAPRPVARRGDFS